MDLHETILPLMESRTEFYRMLAKLYRWSLTEEDYEALDAETFKALSQEDCGELMASGFNDMYRFLRRRNTGTRQTLAVDYTKVFLGTATYEGLSAQPFASLFTGAGGQLMGAERNAVNAIYRKHCVKLSEGIDLPEDHLAFELEFLSIINERAGAAMESGDLDGAIALLATEKSFVEEHLLNWFGRFFNLANKMLDTRFYKGVLKITKAYLADEPDTIAALIESLAQAEAEMAAAEAK